MKQVKKISDFVILVFALLFLQKIYAQPQYSNDNIGKKYINKAKKTSGSIRWQREYSAIVDGHNMPAAYCGGINHSTPVFVDIDDDDDDDLLVGAWNSYNFPSSQLQFCRNDGSKNNPVWHFVAENYNNIDMSNNNISLVDIDADGDKDLFISKSTGQIAYYRNDGTPEVPSWTLIDDYYYSIGSSCSPSFSDIDNDGDLDMFVILYHLFGFHENEGTSQNPVWAPIFYYDGIDISNITHASIAFTDIDNDNDFDLFICVGSGKIRYYRNDGNSAECSWTLVNDDYIPLNFSGAGYIYFSDIDDDEDEDLFVGTQNMGIMHIQNIGTKSDASWMKITDNFYSIDINEEDKYSNRANSIPALCDIDDDGDDDLFLGNYYGEITYYRNDGNSSEPDWTFVTDTYNSIDVDMDSAPTFVDIDDDNDFDFFIGDYYGRITYYRNDGTPQNAAWTLIDENYNSIDYWGGCTPIFADIDSDGDFDLFIGNGDNVDFYRNDGTPQNAAWTLIDENYSPIGVNSCSPAFSDIDNDGDFDLFMGGSNGNIVFCRNEGTAQNAAFVFVDDDYFSYNIGLYATPTFADIDNDGTADAFIGEQNGGINFWRNLGVVSLPDLVIESFNVPDVGYTSQPVSVTNTIMNQGEEDGTEISVQFYLSTDTTITTEDVNLGSRTINHLAPGSSSSDATELIIPDATEIGSYYIGVIIDPDREISESNKINNDAYDPNPIQIFMYQPDLTFKSVESPESALIGQDMNIDFEVQNLGMLPSGSFSINFYLREVFVTIYDRLVGTKTITNVSGTSSLIDNITLNIPFDLNPAYHRLIVVADSENQVPEYNENNNNHRYNIMAISQTGKTGTDKTRLYLVGEDMRLSLTPDDIYFGSHDVENVAGSAAIWDGYFLSDNFTGMEYKLHIWATSPYVWPSPGQTTTDFEGRIYVHEKVVAIFRFTASESDISSGSTYSVTGVGLDTQAGDEIKLRIGYSGGYGGTVFWGSVGSYIEIPLYTEGSPVKDESINPTLPSTFILHQNYPNPFNLITNIRFTLPVPSVVQISVFDLNGRLIQNLFSGKKQTGFHSIIWDASGLSSGTYLIRMKANNFTKIQKCILLK